MLINNLNLFQLDGMNDQSSSSEDDNMVIDEGPLPEDKKCTSKNNATTPNKGETSPHLRESEEEDSDHDSCIINPAFKASSQVEASLGITAKGKQVVKKESIEGKQVSKQESIEGKQVVKQESIR